MFLISFILSALATAVLIPILRKAHFGQAILQIGPSWHNKKNGTPTMGGIGFIFAIVFSAIVALFIYSMKITNIEKQFTNAAFSWPSLFDIRSIAILVFAFAFGAIGFLDDFIKVILKQNQGLKAYQKFGLQFIVAAIGICFLYLSGNISSEIVIPFTHGFMFNLGVWYVPIMIFVVLAIVNAVNLTDGIDGLATSVTIIVLIFFAIISFSIASGSGLIAIISVGALLGFLLFNYNPAKVFMGDTGSLFLGGLIAFFAVVLQNPLIIILAGIVYVVETLSDVLQVIYFKVTGGKRLFLMAPIHHHFEKMGWSEKKVVFAFSAITIVGCIIGYLAT